MRGSALEAGSLPLRKISPEPVPRFAKQPPIPSTGSRAARPPVSRSSYRMRESPGPRSAGALGSHGPSRGAPMLSRWILPALLAIGLCLASSATLQGQLLDTSLDSWSSDSVFLDAPGIAQLHIAPNSERWRSDTLSTRSHTRTGLLIGGLVGSVATAVFLAGFCSDPDTECGLDEIGRAVLFIAVPAAAAGALIGSLIRTKR
jgi:hypothetical protein